MGAQGSRSEGVLQSVNPNGKTLEFLVELCSSWGYNSIVANVKKNLFAELNNKGYEIKYVFEPLSGGNGEFYIYETSLNGKRVIFSKCFLVYLDLSFKSLFNFPPKSYFIFLFWECGIREKP